MTEARDARFGNCLPSKLSGFASLELRGTTSWNTGTVEQSEKSHPACSLWNHLAMFQSVPSLRSRCFSFLPYPVPGVPKVGTQVRLEHPVYLLMKREGKRAAREERDERAGPGVPRLLFCPSILQFRAFGAKTQKPVIKFAPDRTEER